MLALNVLHRPEGKCLRIFSLKMNDAQIWTQLTCLWIIIVHTCTQEHSSTFISVVWNENYKTVFSVAVLDCQSRLRCCQVVIFFPDSLFPTTNININTKHFVSSERNCTTFHNYCISLDTDIQPGIEDLQINTYTSRRPIYKLHFIKTFQV